MGRRGHTLICVLLSSVVKVLLDRSSQKGLVYVMEESKRSSLRNPRYLWWIHVKCNVFGKPVQFFFKCNRHGCSASFTSARRFSHQKCVANGGCFGGWYDYAHDGSCSVDMRGVLVFTVLRGGTSRGHIFVRPSLFCRKGLP